MTTTAPDWVLRLQGGARLQVPPSLEQISTYVLLEQEDWFEDEIRFVRRMLLPGMHVVDIGANLGVYAVAMALGVGPSGRVWAYEPAPDTAARLERNLALNGCGQATVVRAAVSEKPGSLSFAVGDRPELNKVAEGGLTVEATSIDASAAGWGDVAFLKLDVEGHEKETVLGGQAFFREASPLVMLEVMHQGRLESAALELLTAAGYRAYRLLPGLSMLEPVDWTETPDGFLLNLFACKPQTAQQLAARGLLCLDLERPSERAEVGAWGGYAAAAPYARGFAARWRSSAGWFAAADRVRYFEGLSAWARSRDERLPGAARAAWLRLALECLAEALQARPSAARQLSYCRAAADAGWRGAAVSTLGGLTGRLDAFVEAPGDEPFLAPSVRHELADSTDAPEAFLRCAVLESAERLHAFSSCFAGDEIMAVHDLLADVPGRAIETDRRRQLLRLRRGQPLEAGALARLGIDAADHLNAEFWRQHA